MSYSVTAYFNDADIYSTRIYGVNGFVNVTKYYGNSAYSSSGFSGRTTFTATPDDDCEFTQWVYRVIEEGETEADTEQQFSTDNPFVFTGGSSGNASIIIRAEGKSVTTSSWNAWQEEQFDLTTDTVSVDIYNYNTGDWLLEPYNVHRYTATFAYSGYARFYTASDIDTFGYLSDEYDWNNEYSGPLYEIASDDDSGDGRNFCIEYYVTAGVEYNIYVRGLTGSESGWCTLYIEPPTPSWTHTLTKVGEVASNYSLSAYISSYTLKIYQMTFATSGVATFYTDSSLDTRGYLSKYQSYSSGEPTSILASGNDYNGDLDFRFTCDVTANTTYYLFVRCYDASKSGSVNVHIIPPEEKISITKWSWTASNGNASASLTQAAYSAVMDKTAVTNFSYLVWNDLCDKVKEILDATGGSWDSTYATYANTKMISSNKTLTATKFNSLRYNIGSHYSTGITDVAPNDDVLGSYFTKLASCINSWIDTL